MDFAKLCKVVQFTVLCLFGYSTAWGQVGTVQTLDRVDVNSRTNVLEMEFADPARMADFFNTGVSGSDFRACKLTALDGLYCLDGKVVKRWPTGFDDGNAITLSDNPKTIIDCRDSALQLDTRKADTCTALTVDLSGTIWLAGKSKKGPTFVLYRIVEQEGGSCPAGTAELTLTQPPQPPLPGDTVYCAEQVASDKPLLIDLNSIDGDVAEAFPLGRGVLYLEARKTAVFQSDDGLRSTIIASGGKGWDLAGNEKLQSIALWQSPDGTENQVVATTDRGRVLAVAVDEDGDVGPPNEVFNVVNGRGNRDPQDRMATQCDFSVDPRYAVRTSSKSGLVYVTDRQCNEVLALERDGTAAFMLDNAQEPSFDASTGDPICADIGDDPTTDPPCELSGQQVWDLTLSTADSSGTFPPEGPTVAPGIGIDLRTCAGFCALIVGDDGAAAASLANVTLLNPDGPSGLTLFQIKNIPDCRYIPDVCVNDLGVDLAEVVIGPAGDPAAQLLNITPLLPTEITDLFEDTLFDGMLGLPDLIMSRFTRGQKANGFTFEAFFGRTEEGVVFRSTFDGEFDVFALADAELGCESTFPAETPVEDILLWDTVTTVSERYIGTNAQRVDTLINVDCGSSKTLSGRWSLKPYNTEITPCTRAEPGGIWASDGACPPPPIGAPETVVEVVDDAVFAKLLLSLYDDFGDALDQLACVNVDVLDTMGDPDPLVNAPLSPSVCSTAQSQWANGLQKLERCWDATQQPKESSGNQNCQSFVSQFGGLRSTILAATPFGPDPANRVGELVARLAVMDHVYEDRFEPSIPADGFCEPDNPDYQLNQDCTAP